MVPIALVGSCPIIALDGHLVLDTRLGSDEVMHSSTAYHGGGSTEESVPYKVEYKRLLYLPNAVISSL